MGVGIYNQPNAIAGNVIEENSSFMKALSAIPVIGIITSLIQESSLQSQIENAPNTSRAIELIDVKNQYKKMNMVRCLLTAALIIAVVAGISFGTVGGITAIIPIACMLPMCLLFIRLAVRYMDVIEHNEQIMNDLKGSWSNSPPPSDQLSNLCW
jgi:hypothetical protein